MKRAKSAFKWITGPAGFKLIAGLLIATILLLAVYAVLLAVVVISANLERLVLNQEPVLPVWPLEQLTKFVDSIGAVLSSMAKWSGLFTLIAALYAGRKALQVSQHRKTEAESTEFRDSMKWAAEHINLDATDPREMIQSNWALSLIEKYVDNPPASLSEYDRAMAEQLLEEIEASSDREKNNPFDD